MGLRIGYTSEKVGSPPSLIIDGQKVGRCCLNVKHSFVLLIQTMGFLEAPCTNTKYGSPRNAVCVSALCRNKLRVMRRRCCWEEGSDGETLHTSAATLTGSCLQKAPAQPYSYNSAGFWRGAVNKGGGIVSLCPSFGSNVISFQLDVKLSRLSPRQSAAKGRAST